MCQCYYRNIQEIGLTKLYVDDPESGQLIRALMGLALLPVELI